MTSDADGRRRETPSTSDRDMAGPLPLDLVLPRSAEAPGLARQALRGWLAGLACTNGVVEDAVLVVSEVVTNAVVHACSAPRLVVTVVDGRLRVEVHDTSRARPVVRAASTTVGGKGLRILASVTEAWGWSMTNSGKVVWTEQHLEAPSAHRVTLRSHRRDALSRERSS